MRVTSATAHARPNLFRVNEAIRVTPPRTNVQYPASAAINHDVGSVDPVCSDAVARRTRRTFVIAAARTTSTSCRGQLSLKDERLFLMPSQRDPLTQGIVIEANPRLHRVAIAAEVQRLL
jgi:hypothetical protein